MIACANLDWKSQLCNYELFTVKMIFAKKNLLCFFLFFVMKGGFLE